MRLGVSNLSIIVSQPVDSRLDPGAQTWATERATQFPIIRTILMVKFDLLAYMVFNTVVIIVTGWP